jgi:hypothetical protein
MIDSNINNKLNQILQKECKFTLKIFDFDGVLSMPYTMPEEYYKQIPNILSSFNITDVLCCVASFNPRAKLAIEQWKLDHHFIAFRSGSNDIWSNNLDEYKQEYRIGLKKSKQIQSMLSNELKDYKIENIEFYDDDKLNIKEVENELSHINCCLVDNNIGFTI